MIRANFRVPGAKLVLAVLLALMAHGLLTSCGEEFAPRTLLEDLTVLALSADPLEVVGDEEVALTAHLYLPEGAAIASESWRFCPLTAGARTGYACLLPECEAALASAGPGQAVFNPWRLGLACLSALAAPVEAEERPVGPPEELPNPIETVVFYRVESDGGAVREAILRLPVYLTEPPQERNRPPRFLGLRLEDGPLIPADELAGFELPSVARRERLEFTIEVDPESLDLYEDAAGRERTEEPLVSFYATAGRFEWERQAGTTVENTWRARKLEDDAEEALLYFVVRDGRGGQTVAGPARLTITDEF